MKLKKLLALMLTSSLLIASLTACSSEEATTEEETTTEETTTTEEATYEMLDYNSYFTEEGYFNGVTATDYVTMPDYKSEKLPEDTLTATEDEIQVQIDSIMAQAPTTEANTDTSVVAAEGETYNVSFVGSIDGVEFEGGAGTSDLTIGAGDFIPGFEEAIVGHNVGENFDINVTFPDDYGSADLAGQDAVFNITINHGYTTITPEFNDEFVQEYYAGQFESAQELEDAIVESIIFDKQSTYVNEFLIAAEISDLPADLVQFAEDSTIDSLTSTAMQYGMDVETYLLYGTGAESLEAFIESNKESFEEQAAAMLVYQAIMESGDLDLSTENIKYVADQMLGDGMYDLYVESLGANYLASYIGHTLAVQEAHMAMINNTDGAVMPEAYLN